MVTSTVTLSYLAAATGGPLRAARPSPSGVGRRQGVIEVRVHDRGHEDLLVATALLPQFHLGRTSAGPTGGSGYDDAGHRRLRLAMPMELAPLTRALALQRSTEHPSPSYVGRLGRRPVVAVVTGMGTSLATAGVDRLLGHDVERVVVVGITGALDDETPIGTLIRPEQVVDAASGTHYRPDPLGEEVPRGKMWTSDSMITRSRRPGRSAERGGGGPGHGDGGGGGRLSTARHPVVGGPGHQRPGHRRER